MALERVAGNGVDVQVASPDTKTMHDLIAGGFAAFGGARVKWVGSALRGGHRHRGRWKPRHIDPNPIFAQTDLDSYLNGFTITDGTGALVAVQGTVAGVVRFVPQAPTSAFLAAATASAAISSSLGRCGRTLQFPDTAATVTPLTFGTLYFQACDGSNSTYELDIAATGPYVGVFADLSATGSASFALRTGASASQIVQVSSQWTLAPVPVGISAGGVVNAANPTSAIAPGGLFSIFGTGLPARLLQINGQDATVTSATPFLVNAQVPFWNPARFRDAQHRVE